MDVTNDITDKRLLGTPIEKREQKLSILFKDFSERINQQSNESLHHDRDDFMKPVIFRNTNNEEIVMPSEASRLSKISLNGDLKKQNLHDLVCYTNDRRESPNNSFYDPKKEEIYIIDLEEEESKKEDPPQINKVDIEEEELDEEDEFDEIEENNESVTYKEETPHNSESKKKLKPQGNDIMSDFDEKTHGRKIEIFKKNTSEFDKDDKIIDLDQARIEPKEEGKENEEILIKIKTKIQSKMAIN